MAFCQVPSVKTMVVKGILGLQSESEHQSLQGSPFLSLVNWACQPNSSTATFPALDLLKLLFEVLACMYIYLN